MRTLFALIAPTCRGLVLAVMALYRGFATTVVAVVAVACILTTVGCTRTVYVPQVSYHSVIDTVVEQVEDSASLRALFECDSLGQVRMRELDETKGLLARQDVNFANGELRIETRWKTKYIDRLVETRDTISIVKIQEIVREVKHVPKFFWWCFAIAMATVGWGIVRVVLKVKGRF